MNERDRDWVQAKLTPQPVGVYLEPIRLTGAREAVRHKAYVRATLFESKKFESYREEAEKKSWNVYDLGCGHDIMIDDPLGLTVILREMSEAATSPGIS